MCGISVVLDRAASPESIDLLLRMHEPIRHRGPDGEGLLLVDPDARPERRDSAAAATSPFPLRLGMGFRRLKILDLSDAAAQPMASPDGSLWIVYNGEIYNYRELREELRSLGNVFRTTGDTEVILAAFAAWGEGCFERLDGMWALAIADLRRRRLVASRDRFGIKPLYWAADGPRLLLASEAKQILRAQGGRPRANAPLVRGFILGTRLPCLEETFFEGVRSVPPATWFEAAFEGGAVEPPPFRGYWSLADHYCPWPDRPPRSYPDAVDELRTRLARAVASHGRADVAVGSLLSGGLDSSTLVGLAVSTPEPGARPFPTFSLGFRDAAPELCELPYVEAMVRRHGLVNYETTLDAEWVARNARKAIAALEEPPLALPVLAQHRVFELCREHGVTVVLDGQGADEVLAGYPYDERELLLDRLARFRVGDLARELRAIASRHSGGVLDVLGEYFLKPLGRRLLRRSPRWLAPDYGRREDARELEEALRDRGRDPSRVNRRIYHDVKWGNVKLVLGYTDRNAMAHSVEARVPYFDRGLVELAFSLPDSYKVGGGERKRILRDAARDLVPPAITERVDRTGFAVPEGRILKGLWPSVRETLRGGALSGPCFEPEGARRFVDDFEAGRHEDVRAIWRLYALALWRDEFDVHMG